MSKSILDHEIREVITANIKKVRYRSKLTQDGFANLVHSQRAAVGSWEEGRARPSLEMLIRISDVFKVDLREFITKKLE